MSQMDIRPVRASSHIDSPSSTLLSHIDSANWFFESQRALVDDHTLDTTMEAMARATMLAIGNMDIDANHAAVVNSALVSSSFSTPLRAALAGAVAGRVLAGATARTSARKPTQLLSVPNYYFTKTDWARITPRHRLEQVIITVAQRCCGLNLLHPNEQTFGSLGAMIAAAYYPVQDPDPTTLRGLVRDIKAALQRLRPPATGLGTQGLSHIERYPLHPQQCPQEIWSSACPDVDDPPIQVELNNLGRVQRLMVGCLRSRDARSPASSGIDALVGLLQHGRLAPDQTIALPGGHMLQLTNPNTTGAPRARTACHRLLRGHQVSRICSLASVIRGRCSVTTRPFILR
ncbi:hypothetical protein N9L68_07505 [bacterium]|nr:hypothetical protein [bacterium]